MRDLVIVVIPLREVVLVEKVDNAASGELGTDSLVVTTKGKVHNTYILIIRVYCSIIITSSLFNFTLVQRNFCSLSID